ncbi:hypothetical protein CA212_174 [Candidatus Nasuia deltocephalinicola]|nr:hypothetical protein CA212_174 [Candidatus Nasuia deltocephalinicola]
MKKIIINAKNKSLGKILNFLIKIINTKNIKISKFIYNIIIMNVNYIKYTRQ